MVFYGFKEISPKSDLKSANGSVPRRSNLSLKVGEAHGLRPGRLWSRLHYDHRVAARLDRLLCPVLPHWLQDSREPKTESAGNGVQWLEQHSCLLQAFHMVRMGRHCGSGDARCSDSKYI